MMSFHRYGGYIGGLGLHWFWNSLSDRERIAITAYSIDSVGCSPIEGQNKRTSVSQLSFLDTYLLYAISRQDFDVADTIIRACEKADGTKLDSHFFLMSAGECYYKQIKHRDNAIILAIYYFERDVGLFPEYKDDLLRLGRGKMPMVTSFQRLAMCYEKRERYQDAIYICQQALEHGLRETTKTGFQGRINRLMKKMK